MQDETSKTKEQELIELADKYYDKGNYDKAREISEELIKMGSSYGYDILGSIYYFGDGVPVDYQKAKDYYKNQLNWAIHPHV